nr:pilus assembly protein PilM [Clostridia bacterium]
MIIKRIKDKTAVIQLTNAKARVALFDKGSPEFLFATEETLPKGAVEDGYIRDMEAVRQVLSQILTQPDLKRVKRAVFTLSSSHIIASSATVPVMKEKKLEKMLHANMDLYFPVDTSDYNVVWSSGNLSSKAVEGAITLWAVPNGLLASYYHLANSLGLSVLAMDYAGHALANAKNLDFEGPVPASEEGTILHVAADDEHLLATFSRNGEIRLQRLMMRSSSEGDPTSLALDINEMQMLLDYYVESVDSNAGEITCALSGDLAASRDWKEAIPRDLDLHLKA